MFDLQIYHCHRNAFKPPAHNMFLLRRNQLLYVSKLAIDNASYIRPNVQHRYEPLPIVSLNKNEIEK